MRTSKDIYKLNNGKFVAIGGGQEPPKNGKLWRGYNYDLQEWWFEGKKDTRTFIMTYKNGSRRVKKILPGTKALPGTTKKLTKF